MFFFVLFLQNVNTVHYIVEQENVTCLLNTKDMDAQNKKGTIYN